MTRSDGVADAPRRDTLRRHVADLLGASRLAADATVALADVVEHAHRDVLHGPAARGDAPGRLRGISGFVYGRVRATAGLAGRALAASTPAVAPVPASAAGREATVAALNGVVGDHLAATANPLAIPMRLRVGGPDGCAVPPRNARVLVLVHGLCMGPRQWLRRGHDHGAALARDLGLAPVYLHYNTGRHVSENGRAFAAALEALLGRWPVPVEELTIVAHSMGGLVARSACHYAATLGQAWPRVLRRLVFLGTPHHGAPLERGGLRANAALGALPYAAAYARIGRLRSAGITDLRHGNLLDEDWRGVDRFAGPADGRRPVPLPAGVECHAFAATLGVTVGGTLGASWGSRAAGLADAVVGDGLVPVASALGEHPDAARDLGLPDARRWVGRGLHHLDLLDAPAVYAALVQRLAPR